MTEIAAESGSDLQQLADIVRRTEELAYSTEWRQTALTMRELRRQFQALQPDDNDSWAVRFRLAQQTFMDRRSDFYTRGNRHKGADLRFKVADLQQRAGELRESIQYCHQTIKDYQQQEADLPDGDNRASIAAFIAESCREVNRDIELKTATLTKVEEEIVILSTRFCSPE